MKKLAFLPLAVLASSAFAEVPAGVTAAITAAGTDQTSVITAMIVVAAGIWGLYKIAGMFGRR